MAAVNSLEVFPLPQVVLALRFRSMLRYRKMFPHYDLYSTVNMIGFQLSHVSIGLIDYSVVHTDLPDACRARGSLT